MRGVALLLLAFLAAAPARAHPHVFVDGGVDFVFDAQGRLARIRVTWLYDAFSSLYVIESLGFDADGDGALTAKERDFLTKDQTEWPEDFEGDSYLYVGEARVALGRPVDGAADYRDGRIWVQVDRRVAEPFRPDRAVAKLYDPYYFFAYTVTEDPEVSGAPDCKARVDVFEPDSDLIALQQRLAAIPRDGEQSDASVGALFADEIILTCP